MFTGIIETIGRVAAVESRRGSSRISVVSDLPAAEITLGESVSVDGVCLTVAANKGHVLAFDAVAETLARTTLGSMRAGAAVNLERALRVGDRLGGHMVQGHVDAVSGIARITRRGDDCRMRVKLVRESRPYVAFKGSVALNGVSLTVAAVDRSTFEVALIPETLARTNLSKLKPGDHVNVEVDLVARYLEALARERGGRSRT